MAKIWYIIGAITIVGMFQLFIFGLSRIEFFKRFDSYFMEYLTKGALYAVLCILGLFYLKAKDNYYLNAWVSIVSALESISNIKNAYYSYCKGDESDKEDKKVKAGDIGVAFIAFAVVAIAALLIFWFFMGVFWKK